MRKQALLGAAGAMAIVAVLGIGCSGKKEPARGELMISIQTDMSVPDDFDTIVLEVSAYGSTYHRSPYTVGPSREIRIPATFGVVEGANPSTPVRIVVTAEGMQKTRILREVVTTVPHGRIALLRIPLQWLCDGEVIEKNGVVSSSCPQEQTCIAGQCQPVKVDSSTLEDYTPAAVFGGAAGPDMDGECLDTVECFSHGYQVVFDPSNCTIEKPSGGEGTNVALFGPTGTVGICGPQACLIPLDKEPNYGWTEEGSRLKLPKAACDKVAAHEMTGIAVTTACATKTPSIPTCGPWSSVSHSSNFDASAPEAMAPTDAEAGAEAAPDTSADGAEEDVVDAGPQQSFYDLSTEFSITSNPFGAWEAGWVVVDPDGGAMPLNLFNTTDLTQTLRPFWYDTTNYNMGAPMFGINKTGGTIGPIADGALILAPGSGQETWVRWTAPGDGTAQVHADFLLGDTMGDITARILVDGASVWEQGLNMSNMQRTWDSPTPIKTVTGTQIAYVVHSNGTYTYDTAGLRANITYTGPGASHFKPPQLSSCNAQQMGCGMQGTDPCCVNSEAPAGQYNRNNNSSFPATVKSYSLGTFEVTVGRFRRFLAEYPGSIPRAGEGKNPLVAADPGWDPSWNALMPATASELSTALGCDSFYTWTPTADMNEFFPINCVTWYEAAAFCAWDGGFLPTEVEWNYAAAGGDEQRPYPWGIDVPDAGMQAIFSETTAVPGTADSGMGKWFHYDLAGNVAEWVLDIHSNSLPMPCDHCANLTGGTARVVHDSGWNTAPGQETQMLTSARRSLAPGTREMGTGFRCAYGCVEESKRCTGPDQPQLCVGGAWMDQAKCAEDQLCSGDGTCF